MSIALTGRFGAEFEFLSHILHRVHVTDDKQYNGVDYLSHISRNSKVSSITKASTTYYLEFLLLRLLFHRQSHPTLIPIQKRNR